MLEVLVLMLKLVWTRHLSEEGELMELLPEPKLKVFYAVEVS